jgi:hypothetical protein
MGTASRTRAGIPVRDVALAALGYGGGAMSITLMFLGMRAVMDIGGYCAEGGPYEIATHCPDGATPALLLGIFGLFLFGFLATVYGIRVGGIWVAAPLLGWSALFGVLGWNFIEYGVLNAPADTGIDWGWALCGVVFWMMAAGPLVALLPIGAGLLDMPASAIDGRAAAKAAAKPVDLPGPGQPAVVRIITPQGVEIRDAHDPETKAQLAAIDQAMAAALTTAAASTPLDPDAREGTARAGSVPAPTAAGGEGDEFSEGTQALLDRLERLADMRDRGLLEDAEYETAKEAIVRELEARQ